MQKAFGRLESVAHFTEFVKAFSSFGAEMVELAHITSTYNYFKKECAYIYN